MTLFAWLIILSLANNAIVELVHHSVLFKKVKLKLTKINWLTGLNCPYCFSYRSALILSLIPKLGIFEILIMTLAVARLSNIINDYLSIYNRTPKE